MRAIRPRILHPAVFERHLNARVQCALLASSWDIGEVDVGLRVAKALCPAGRAVKFPTALESGLSSRFRSLQPAGGRIRKTLGSRNPEPDRWRASASDASARSGGESVPARSPGDAETDRQQRDQRPSEGLGSPAVQQQAP